MARKPALVLPEVTFSDWGDVRHLHLDSIWIQGSMKIDEPFEIELDYVQRMMAWLLLLAPLELRLRQRHAMQLGLGAAALTKFCYKKLRMKTTAVELNPQVVAACRGWFKLPPDDDRLSVVLADAGQEIKRPQWQGSVDALQVDLYDQEAAGPVLDSAAFYADCRALLTEDGCMSVNLFGRDSSYDASLEKIVTAFGAQAVWAFRPTREGNTVVLAQRTATRPSRPELAERAQNIQTRYQLPAAKWLRILKPVA